jgi:16S rRNA (guanine(966)-N(2))-methyltransferase RsmD
LTGRLHGAAFLDLFAGSGAMGIEALSRGAAEAVFVDSSPAAITAIRQNLAKTKLDGEVIRATVAQALAGLKRRFDIIFLDPPYNTPLLSETLEILFCSDLLQKQGIIIAESGTNGADGGKVSLPQKNLTSTRSYGRTAFHFYEIDQINEVTPNGCTPGLS